MPKCKCVGPDECPEDEYDELRKEFSQLRAVTLYLVWCVAFLFTILATVVVILIVKL